MQDPYLDEDGVLVRQCVRITAIFIFCDVPSWYEQYLGLFDSCSNSYAPSLQDSLYFTLPPAVFYSQSRQRPAVLYLTPLPVLQVRLELVRAQLLAGAFCAASRRPYA